MSRTQQGATNWYALDGATEDTRMGIIPLAFDFDSAGTSSYVEISGMQVDFQEAGERIEQELAQFRVRARVDSNSDWDVQLWDESAGAELAVINFTETSLTNKSATFSLPSSSKSVTVRVRKNVGTGAKRIDLKSAHIVWRATP